MTEAADDARLLRLTAEGDPAAFSELMERHADPVYRLLKSLGSTPEDAEDALQECFISAWRGAHTYEGSGSVRSWLFTIARHTLYRQFRRRAGEPPDAESLEVLAAEAGWGESTDFTHQLAARDEVEWALAQIPMSERQVVVLRDLEGFSGEEVADVLELSLSAMKSRLHRGRLRLMKIVREGGALG